MSETLEPLSTEARSLMSRAEVPEPPAELEEHLFVRLQSALAPVVAPAPSAPAGAPSVSAGLGQFGLPLSLASLVVGIVLGGVLRPLAFPPSQPVALAPAPIEVAAATVEPEISAPPKRAPRPAPVPIQAAKARPAVNPDALLAEERNLIETARSALVRGEPKLAAEALQRHASKFETGRLAEERESLWIQALIRSGEFDQARAHATRFRQQFPRSLLLPAVEAALASIP